MRRSLLDNAVARTVFSVWSWLVLGVVVIVWVPLVAVVRLVTAPFDRGRYAAGWLFRRLPVVHQVLNPLWRFRIVGSCRPTRAGPYVVVSNHESFVDILLISHLPWEMKWLSKTEMFKIPCVGWLMRMARRHPTGARRQRERRRGDAGVRRPPGRAGLGDDLPRGHAFGERRARRRSGRGAFQLAIDSQLPILPLAVHGTRGACASTTGASGCPTPTSTSSNRSRRRG